jgi:hypothetical protein
MSNAPAKFQIAPNGDDARTVATAETYSEAERLGAELSVGHVLGMKVIGPSGRKILTYLDGAETGYLDGNEGWVAR